MLRKISDLKNLRLVASDGEIGRVRDFYFDDRHWALRYLVADTGKWLPGRQVLISPYSLGPVTRDGLTVNLTKKQIEDSPPIHEHEPVSRQYEARYYGYYGWPYYWTGPAVWGAEPYPGVYSPAYAQPAAELHHEAAPEDSHLRSATAVAGYAFQALDGEIGHVEDFIIGDRDWVIRYVVVDTRNWWPGKKVLLSPRWISSIDWHRSAVGVNLSREGIRSAPEFHPNEPVSREYEERLFDHYGREAYWSGHEMVHH